MPVFPHGILIASKNACNFGKTLAIVAGEQKNISYIKYKFTSSPHGGRSSENVGKASRNLSCWPDWTFIKKSYLKLLSLHAKLVWNYENIERKGMHTLPF